MTNTVSANSFYVFTLESLSRHGSDRARVEDWAESQAPRAAFGEALTDIVDRLDGSPWLAGGSARTIDLGNSYGDPVFKRLRSIVGRVIRECLA